MLLKALQFLLIIGSFFYCGDDTLLDKNPTSTGSFVPCTTDVASKDSFEIDDTISQVPATSFLLTNKTSVSHTIHNCNDVDFVKLTISTAGYYSVYAHTINDGLQTGLSLCISEASCVASSLVMAANENSGLIFSMAATTYYVKARSWNFTTGLYQLYIKDHTATTSQAITDTESSNDTIAGAKAIAALAPQNVYTGGALFTTTTDTKDYYRLTSLVAGNLYYIAASTTVTNANLTVKLYDSDAKNNVELEKYVLRSGTAQFLFKAETVDDIYFSLENNVSLSNNQVGVAINSYQIIFDIP